MSVEFLISAEHTNLIICKLPFSLRFAKKKKKKTITNKKCSYLIRTLFSCAPAIDNFSFIFDGFLLENILSIPLE